MGEIIALRFRDTNSRVDTITEHRKILTAKGEVWWGWWRKDFEADTTNELLGLVADNVEVYLVDASTSRLFKCRCSDIRRILPKKLLSLVPKYYRADAKRVTAWFCFQSLQNVSGKFKTFPPLSQPTLYRLNRSKDGSLRLIDGLAAQIASGTVNPDQMFAAELFHLSDLHYGSDHAFARPGKTIAIGGPLFLSEVVAKDSERIRVDKSRHPIVCLTGDITTRGIWSNQVTQEAKQGLLSLGRELGVDSKHFLLIPGNHDMERYDTSDPDYTDPTAFHNPTIDYKHEHGFRMFRSNTTGEDSLRPLSTFRRFKTAEGFEIHIAGMNSCRITSTQFTEYGWVGNDELQRMFDWFHSLKDVTAIRILALHHHVVPLSDILTPEKNGVTLTLDAGPVLREAQRAGIRLILHGHQHLPAISKFAIAYLEQGIWKGLHDEDIFVVSAGSAGSKILPNAIPNSYTHLQFLKDKTEIRIRQLRTDGSELTEFVKMTIPVGPDIIRT